MMTRMVGWIEDEDEHEEEDDCSGK